MRRLLATLACTLALSANAQESNFQSVMRQATAEYDIGHITEAINLLEEGMSQCPASMRNQAYHLLAICYLQIDNQEQAEANTIQMLRLDPYYSPVMSDPVRFVELLSQLRGSQDATITTASQQAEKIEEAPVPVTLITEDMILASGARNLRELLSIYVPGISPIEYMESNMGVRGVYTYTQESVLIMRDGVRLNSHTTNSAPPDYRINLDNIKHIEVLRGPASSLYGNVALTAVVNIITKSGGDIDGLQVKGAAGSGNTFRGSALFGKHYVDTDIAIWASVYASDGYKYSLSPGDAHFYGPIQQPGTVYSEAYNRAPSIDVGLRYTWKRLTFQASHQQGKRVSPYTSVFLVSPYDYKRYSNIDGSYPGMGNKSTRASAEYVHPIGKGSIIANASLNYETYHRYDCLGDTLTPAMKTQLATFLMPHMSDIQGLDPTFLLQRFSTGNFFYASWRDINYAVNLKWAQPYKLGSHSGDFMLGVSYDHMHVYSNNLMLGDNFGDVLITQSNMEKFFSNGSEHTTSGYVQLKHRFSPQFIFNGGLRYDNKERYDGTGTKEWSPRLALIYMPSQRFSIKGSYSKSYVDASYFDRAVGILFSRDAGELSPQYMHSFQLSADVKLIPSVLSWTSNVFYNHVKDLIELEVSSQKYANTDKVDVAGWENEFSLTLPHFKAYANVTAQRLISASSINARGNYMAAVPNITANLVAEKELNTLLPNLFVHGTLSFRGKQPNTMAATRTYIDGQPFTGDPGMQSAYCLLDLGARYTWRWLQVGLDGHNMLGTDYTVSGDRVPVPQPGRTVLATVGVKL